MKKLSHIRRKLIKENIQKNKARVPKLEPCFPSEHTKKILKVIKDRYPEYYDKANSIWWLLGNKDTPVEEAVERFVNSQN